MNSMLKRVDIEHLRVGMFVHEFCGSWMEHPFLRTRFLLDHARDLERLRSTTIRHVWIDTSKGIDIALSPAETARTPSVAETPTPVPEHPPAATHVELHQARHIISQACDVLKDMLHDVRLGQPVDQATSGQLVEQMSQSIQRNPHALISLARLKTTDNYSYMHSVAVCALMIGLAHRMNLNEHQVRQAGIAGLMHDIGKTQVPLEILNKPGALNPQEWDIMKSHPRKGYEILQPQGLEDVIIDACLHHHEKVDGSGYPDGLKHDEISLLARMTAVCDVYDAVTSDRPYKKAWPPAIALQRMAQWAPQQFDKAIFEQFVQTVGIYPLGSLVRLHSQHLAVVIDIAPARLLTPQVRRFYCLQQKCRITPEVVDLASPEANNSITGREDPDDWPFRNLDALWNVSSTQP